MSDMPREKRYYGQECCWEATENQPRIIRYFVGMVMMPLLLLMLCASGVFANEYEVYGNYVVSFQTGYGQTYTSPPYDFSSDPSEPLVFLQSYTNQLNSSASAQAGFWGQGGTDYWAAWLTEGTGVSQSHPEEVVEDPARMEIQFDFYVSGDGLSTAWYDAMYLNGYVGAGGYVEFIGENDMFIISSAGDETYHSSALLHYFNDNEGAFYVSLQEEACNWFDPIWRELSSGEGMHFNGVYTFTAKNDGGPSLLQFTQNEPPAAVPEPSTMLLLGAGLAGLTAVRRRIRK